MSKPLNNINRIPLIETAKHFFWKHGVQEVSVAQICDALNISEADFNQNFKNKESLLQEVMDLFAQNVMQGYRDIMTEDIAFQYKVARLIQLKNDQLADAGPTFIREIYQEQSATNLRQNIDALQARLRAAITNDMEEAQQRGEIRKDMKISFLLYMLDDLERKNSSPTLQKMYANKKELSMELTNFFFYGILP